MFIPNVLEKTSSGDRVYDLYSKLLEDFIQFCLQSPSIHMEV